LISDGAFNDPVPTIIVAESSLYCRRLRMTRQHCCAGERKQIEYSIAFKEAGEHVAKRAITIAQVCDNRGFGYVKDAVSHTRNESLLYEPKNRLRLSSD